ncbi:MAG: 1-deoxy-D-xylulose-5-phosphate synthase [Schleiferiaceae bacterium]|nr:1-deoxy-D-xylulose-5-phosphate synthase [Schleiferiaceae bacterium]
MSSLPRLEDLRLMRPEALVAVAEEVRSFILTSTKDKAGHLASSLGVAELTVALHALLNTPEDVLIWDVGHQAYVHKVLTDRAGVFFANRQPGGPSGFPNRDESPFDAFGVGHSSTSLSALLGFARADALQGIQRKRVAVIGDGAFTGGMVFEAMNDAGSLGDDVLVILNDNGQAIEENVGALHQNGRYESLAQALGWSWMGGPINGQDIPELYSALSDALDQSGPRILHVQTRRPSLDSLGLKDGAIGAKHFQYHFAQALISMATEDERIVALTAAMAPGCSLDLFRDAFPHRFFDGGIAEGHVLTQAAGMAAAGLRPIVNFYSTFSQRAVDQWIHDVALQNLPVIMCLDRAGLVGEDGGTHHGVFDLALFRAVPNTAIWAPRDGAALKEALTEALAYGGPAIIRYPKGTEQELPRALERRGRMDIMRWGTGTVHFCLGPSVSEALAEALPSETVVDLRMAKPINPDMLAFFAKNHYRWMVWEDGQAMGGVGAALSTWLAENGIPGVQCLRRSFPDRFIGHGPSEALTTESRRNPA